MKALIGGSPNPSGYFDVEGERDSDQWGSVGVIVATGWIHVESDSLFVD